MSIARGQPNSALRHDKTRLDVRVLCLVNIVSALDTYKAKRNWARESINIVEGGGIERGEMEGGD